MKVTIFGATGMVGQGVLRECLADPGVESVVVVSRTPIGKSDPKLVEIVQRDLFDVAPFLDAVAGCDACFFCIGVSSAGMSEADYRRVTHDLTLAIARPLSARNPRMTFVLVTGASTDETGKSGMMWARVKGETENAIRALPFARAVMFRPGFIRPGPGIVSRTALYRVLYAVLWPLVPVLRLLFPSKMTSTEAVGQAMLAVARGAAGGPIVENDEINRIAAGARVAAAAK